MDREFVIFLFLNFEKEKIAIFYRLLKLVVNLLIIAKALQLLCAADRCGLRWI